MLTVHPPISTPALSFALAYFSVVWFAALYLDAYRADPLGAFVRDRGVGAGARGATNWDACRI